MIINKWEVVIESIHTIDSISSTKGNVQDELAMGVERTQCEIREKTGEKKIQIINQ